MSRHNQRRTNGEHPHLAITIQHPTFGLYLLCLLALGLGTIGTILATEHHLDLELQDAFIVLDTDATSISVRWSK